MKEIYENPMYKRTRGTLVFLCFVVCVADLLGYTPDYILGGRTGNLAAAIMLMPQLVEDSYYWWQKKKLSKS